jgi:hypothetical protein
MPSSGMRRRVAHVRTDNSEEGDKNHRARNNVSSN